VEWCVDVESGLDQTRAIKGVLDGVEAAGKRRAVLEVFKPPSGDDSRALGPWSKPAHWSEDGGDKKKLGNMAAQRYELPQWEAFDLLRSTTVGRICIIDHDFPVAIPMNFRVVGQANDFRLVVRTARGTAVGEYVGPASLEVDQIDLDRGAAWSVIARGMLRPVAASDWLPDPHPLLHDRHEWMLLEPTAISGRRFSFDGPQDSFMVDWASP
jgi:uncharacterized protein